MASLGVALGLAVAPATLDAFTSLMEKELGGTRKLILHVEVVLLAIVAAALAAMFASALPAWRSGRLRIVDALKKIA